VQRRTGGLAVLVLSGLLAACTTDPGVVATQAQAGTAATSTPSTTSPPTTEPVPGTQPPSDTRPPDASTPASASVPPVSDENGIGDTLFPALGNPGIDVQHYVVSLQYDPVRKQISATVHLDIDMTQDRSTFSLDSAGPVVSAVRVDGAPASFEAANPELIITPASPLTNGQRIGVDIDYTIDNPQPVLSESGGSVGWFSTPGGSYVLDEPEGARTWLPSDDHPSDKASFRFEVTVPTGVAAIANGGLLDHTSATSTDTWVWQEDRQMATYMIQLLTGDYEIVGGSGPNGLPLVSVVLHSDRSTMQPYIDGIADEIDFFDDFFGPYPLDRYGIAITDSVPGLAMETFERSLFSRGDFTSGRLEMGQELLLSHELAHQWFGDAVTPADWGRRLVVRELRDVRRVDVARPSRPTADRTGGRGRIGGTAGRCDGVADGRRDVRVQQLRRWCRGAARSAQDHRRRQVLRAAAAVGSGQQRQVAHHGRFRGPCRAGRRPGSDPILRHMAVRRRGADRIPLTNRTGEVWKRAQTGTKTPAEMESAIRGANPVVDRPARQRESHDAWLEAAVNNRSLPGDGGRSRRDRSRALAGTDRQIAGRFGTASSRRGIWEAAGDVRREPRPDRRVRALLRAGQSVCVLSDTDRSVDVVPRSPVDLG
jgi:hypothetical protein